jgi:hypothetical protein
MEYSIYFDFFENIINVLAKAEQKKILFLLSSNGEEFYDTYMNHPDDYIDYKKQSIDVFGGSDGDITITFEELAQKRLEKEVKDSWKEIQKSYYTLSDADKKSVVKRIREHIAGLTNRIQTKIKNKSAVKLLVNALSEIENLIVATYLENSSAPFTGNKIKWNGTDTMLATLFYRLTTAEYNGKKLLEADPSIIADLLHTSFINNDGSKIDKEYLAKLISPNTKRKKSTEIQVIVSGKTF